ncbi:MAG: hypothetical protein J1F39_02300 [Clostridiales bacterium]|nr:hypothetical protein [Clostridiales bacterium]
MKTRKLTNMLFSILMAVCLAVSAVVFAACDETTTPPEDTSSLTLNVATCNVEEGKTTVLKATATGIEGDITWTTDKKTVVSLDKTVGTSVTLTGLAVGTCVVTASAGEKTASCTVTVTPDTTPKLELNHTELEIDQYTTAELVADVKNITGDVRWTTSSNLTVSLSSDTGNSVTITGLKAGVSTIKATAGGKTAQCIVTVNYVASPDSPSDEGWNVTDNGDGTNKFKFEAETGLMEYTYSEQMTQIPSKGLETTLEKNNYPSGDGFVFSLDFGARFSETGISLTYEINSSEATEATLSIAMGLGKNAGTCNEMWEITANGTLLEVSDEVNFPVYSGTVWYDWNNIEVCKVQLVKGKNTFVFKYIWTKGMNFDYFTLDVDSSVNLAVYAEHTAGEHSYGEWKLLEEPDDSEGGMARKYCEYCRFYNTHRIPAIGEEGWEEDEVVACDEYHYGISNYKYSIDGQEMCSYSKRKNPTKETNEFIFECESMEYTSTNSKVGPKYDSATASNEGYLGELNTSTFTITLTLTAEQACSALLIFRGGFKNGVTVRFNDKNGALIVNEEPVNVDDSVQFVGKGWTTWEEYEVCVITLKEGENKITISHPNGGNFGNLDYWKLVCSSTLTVVEPEEDI